MLDSQRPTSDRHLSERHLSAQYQIGHHPAELSVDAARRPPRPSIHYRNSALLAAIFSAPLKQVQALIPAGMMTPLRCNSREALVTVSWGQHGDSDIGSYNDLSIAVPVCQQPRRGLLAGAMDIFFSRGRKSAGLYVINQLVSSPAGALIGSQLSGSDEGLSDIDFRWQGVHFCGVARAAGKHQMLSCLRGRSWPLLRLPLATLNLYHHHDGEPVLNRMHINGPTHLHRGREMMLEVGQEPHPVSDLLREIGIAGRRPLALLSSWQLDCELQLTV